MHASHIINPTNNTSQRSKKHITSHQIILSPSCTRRTKPFLYTQVTSHTRPFYARLSYTRIIHTIVSQTRRYTPSPYAQMTPCTDSRTIIPQVPHYSRKRLFYSTLTASPHTASPHAHHTNTDQEEVASLRPQICAGCAPLSAPRRRHERRTPRLVQRLAGADTRFIPWGSILPLRTLFVHIYCEYQDVKSN
jgi:hypothetical protein